MIRPPLVTNITKRVVYVLTFWQYLTEPNELTDWQYAIGNLRNYSVFTIMSVKCLHHVQDFKETTIDREREMFCFPEQLLETSRSESKSSSSVSPSVLVIWAEPILKISKHFWRHVMWCWKIITVDESFQQWHEHMITDLSLKDWSTR